MIKAITNEELRDKIVKLAMLQHRKLYRHGQFGPDTFDCAGFVFYVYEKVLGINIFDEGIGKSTTTRTMASKYGMLTYFNENETNKDLSKIKKGDILFFHRQSLTDNEPSEFNKYPGHVGIYLGDGRFIHAPRKLGHVAIHSFRKSEYWTKKLVASKDIISSRS